MECGDLREVMSSLFNDMTQYSYYPKNHHYQQAIYTLLSSYPYLKRGMAAADAQDYYTTKLKEAFRNLRKRRCRDEPSCAQWISKMARRRASEVTNAPIVKKSDPFGILNFLPERKEGEDEESIAHYHEVVVEQGRLLVEKRDKGLLEVAMERTFSERRKMIVTDQERLETVILRYPVLTDEDQIFAEFQRLTELDPVKAINKGFDTYAGRMLRIPFKKVGEKERSFREMMSQARTPKERQYATYCAAVYALPRLLKEEAKFIEPETLQGVAYPTIVARDDIYQIVVDNKYLCRTKDLITAMTAMICCYYIFNICYPASSSNSLFFIQKVFLGIGGSNVKNTRVTSLIGKLSLLE